MLTFTKFSLLNLFFSNYYNVSHSSGEVNFLFLFLVWELINNESNTPK